MGRAPYEMVGPVVGGGAVIAPKRVVVAASDQHLDVGHDGVTVESGMGTRRPGRGTPSFGAPSIDAITDAVRLA